MKQKSTFKMLLALMLMVFCGSGAWAQNVLFEETFTACTGTMGWSGGAGNGTFTPDNTGWTGTKMNGAGGAAKFGSGSSLGTAQTPAIETITNKRNVILTFDAGAWDKDNTNLKLSIIGNGAFDNKNSKSTTATLKNKAWTTFTVNITDFDNTTQIKFEGNSNSKSRFFLDNVVIKEAGNPNKQKQPLSFGETTEFTIIEGATFTAPTLTGASTTVTYESSDEKVATVDASTGTVTLVGGIGTTTITANAVEDATYNSASASYTLTVNPAPKYVANIAEFLAKEAGTQTVYTFTNPVTVIKQHSDKYGDDLWVTDETGFLCIHNDVKITYQPGDQIPAGFSGSYQLSGNIKQLIPAEGFKEASVHNVQIAPKELTLPVATGDINTYAIIKGVTLNTINRNITIETDGTLKTLNYFDKFKSAEFPTDLTQKYDVIGIINEYNSNLQINPISINLYDDPTKIDQLLSFPQERYTILTGETFNAPTVQNAKTTVTYSSSNANVATIDANTGAVTIKGLGTTTITAAAAAEGKYNAGTASYELSVEVGGAAVPFSFTGTHSNLDPNFVEAKLGSSNYSGKANLQFKATGNVLTLKLDKEYNNLELSYFIKLNGSPKAGNEYTVSTSTDNVDFTPVKVYGEELDGTELAESIILPNAVRYIRWEYTNKAAGNVGMGNISIKAAPTSYNVTLSDAGVATFAAKQAYSMPAGLKGGIVTTEGDVAHVDYVYAEGSVVPAEEALVLQGAAGDYTLNVATTTEAKKEGNQLKGAFTNAEIKAPTGTKLYILAKDAQNGLGFYFQGKTADGSKVSNLAGKAYLEVANAVAPANGFRLAEGDVTGIEAVESANENAAIYTISGVRVNAQKSNLPKGLYIINGQKVLVK